MTQVPDAEMMKAFNKNIVDEFRANGGKVGGQFEGANLLLLTTHGRQVGPAAAGAAGLLHDRRQDDHHRLQGGCRHQPRLGAQSAGQPCGRTSRSAPTPTTSPARELPAAERDEIFDKVVAAAPGFGEYQSKTSRVIPLFELQRD